MGLFSALSHLFGDQKRVSVKYNSDGRRGYEVDQVTFEGDNAQAEADAWIARASGPAKNYRTTRT